MTDTDNDRYVTAEQAADLLGTSPRTVHRYGEGGRLRTRKAGRRLMYHAGDVQQMVDDLEAQRRGPGPDEFTEIRNQLQAANYRIGYLEAQLDRRLLPDHEMQMREELIKVRTERDMLQQSLARASAPWRTWLIIALVIVVTVLVTILVVVLY